jgi:putative membrane protein
MPSEPGGAPPASPRAERRLPGIALVFSFLRSLQTYALPLLLLIFFSRGDGYERWLLIFLLPSMAFAVLRYFTFTYSFGADDLVIRSGLLFRQERHIPYSRIQNVDLRQNPLHRLAKVAVVRLETGSGGEAEAEIEVLHHAAIAELRAAIFGRGGALGEAQGEARDNLPLEAAASAGESPGDGSLAATAARSAPLLELGAGELVLRGLLTGRGWLLVAAGLGLAHQFDLLDFGDQLEHLQEQSYFGASFEVPQIQIDSLADLAAFVRGLFSLENLLLLLLFVAAVLVATRLLSVVWTLATFWGFRLSRRGQDLTSEQGLITRISATLPRHRIQALELRVGWLDGLFGRAAVVAATAGRGLKRAEDGESPSSEQADLFLAPILRRDAAEDLMQNVAPELFEGQLEWHGFAAGTFGRLFKKSLLILLPLAILAGWLLGPVFALPFALLLGFDWVATRRYVARSRWALGKQAIFWRSGVFDEVSKVVPLEKIQVVVLHSSPFDRRRGTASVQVDTAATDMMNPTLVLPFLDAAAARDLASRLENETGRRSFRW